MPINLILSNKTFHDILLKPEMDNMCIMNKNLKINHTLTKHDEYKHGKRTGPCGRINQRMLEQLGFPFNPEVDTETVILICGPNSFEQDMIKMLASFGWERNVNMFKY